MPEFFIRANSFATLIMSQQSTAFVEGTDAADALTLFVAGYKHPAGLYAAVAYTSSDAELKGEQPLARWLSNHSRAILEATRVKACCSVYSNGPGNVEIDRVKLDIPDPKGGRLDD